MLGRIARHLKISVSAIMDGITQEQADQITELTIFKRYGNNIRFRY